MLRIVRTGGGRAFIEYDPLVDISVLQFPVKAQGVGWHAGVIGWRQNCR